MDKRTLLNAIINRLAFELDQLTKAALATHAEATSEENRAENKYDTRGLEASYLADGQSRAAEEAAQSLTQFRSLAMRDRVAGEPITLGALVTVSAADGSLSHYFVGPRAGGTEIEVEGQTVLVVTPSSPLGRQLVSKRAGDSVVVQRAGRSSQFQIVEVR